jgi:hypothetical protein
MEAAMLLFSPKDGERYPKDDVVGRCLAYIHSPSFGGNVTEKEQKIA